MEKQGNYAGVEDYVRPFPSRLRRLMKETRTTQADLAAILDMTRQGVALYTSGQTTPDLEKFTKIADHFGVSYGYLLGRSEARHREHHNAVEQTGLSEKAVFVLKNWHEAVDELQKDGVIAAKAVQTKAPKELSWLLESKRLFRLVCYIRALGYVKDQKTTTKNLILGPAKVKALKDEIGTNNTREYILFLITNTFRDIINEISPYTPVEGETRPITQADLEDLWGAHFKTGANKPSTPNVESAARALRAARPGLEKGKESEANE